MIEKMKEAVRRGGEVLMSLRTSDLGVQKKQDGSFVTKADLASQEVIFSHLNESIPFLSEEAVVPYEKRAHWDSFFLLDPLDGTKGYIEGRDDFVILLAYIQEGLPLIGVTYCPTSQELYWAEKGKGAFLEKEGLIIRLPIEEGKKCIQSRTDFDPRLQEFLDLGGYSEIEREEKSSGLKFAEVALGRAALYPRFKGTFEWDVAAGDLLVQESGGLMLEVKTQMPLRYNSPLLKVGPFIAFRPSESKKVEKYLLNLKK